jgi:radical SAM superfamily enzyme YgiQ (UPF0313 family)
VDSRVRRVKLYFLFGVPGEDPRDAEAAFEAASRWESRLRSRGAHRKVQVSPGFLIPKAWTPLQWWRIPHKPEIERKRRELLRLSGRILGQRVRVGSAASVLRQALLSLGDERVGLAMIDTVRSGGPLWKRCRERGVDTDRLLHREKPEEWVFPWDGIDTGIDRKRLYREYRIVVEGVVEKDSQGT